MMDLSVVPYETKPEAVGSPTGDLISTAARYRECMRNHAASLGGHAFDGCGEFMPSSAAPGDQLKCASGDSLKCAACGCHRNFHRRDGAASGKPLRLLPPPPGPFPTIFASPYSRIPPPQPAAARIGSETPPRTDGGERSRKRMRTKFTADQKEKMQAFAEKLGWRIQKQDDVALEEFCVEIGVKRHVLKVWMHNNKHHFSSASPAAVENGGKRGGDVSPATAISV